MTKCFNGHRWPHRGCAGCHHAFHVVEPGKVSDGRLVPPLVRGPLSCELCHLARHQVPVSGCPQCAGRFEDSVHQAMVATQGVRQEIWGLRFLGWMIGWPPRIVGWLGLLIGGGLGDWFQRSDGSQNWFAFLVAAVLVPLAQWGIRRGIRRRRQMLPRLTPKGEIVYGPDPIEESQGSLRR
jgi:hypothetical protein